MDDLPITGNPANSRGMALVLVLWVVVLLTIMAGSFALSMKREINVVSGVKELAQTKALAEAGINYAMLRMLSNNAEERWEGDSIIHEMNFSAAKIRIMIVDESGKISLTRINPVLFKGLLNEVGVAEEGDQDRIIDAIQDWQDKNDLARLNGAEKDQYIDAGLSYGPTNKPFQIVDELQMVMGINADLFEQIEPLLTVYSRRNNVNLKKAPREVLLTMQDVDPETVDNFLKERAENSKQGLPAPNFPGAAGQGGSVNVFTLISEVLLPNGTTGKIRAVVRKSKSRRGLPFSILEWDTTQIGQESLFSGYYDEMIVN